jgi:hypothetical protein
MAITGILSKMESVSSHPISYTLTLGKENFGLSERVGKTLSLVHTGNIFCTNCGKKTKKSYSQGYCFPCTTKLAECDLCILKPETCHFDKGTCRDPAWGEEHCMKPHWVYLANSSGLKVGITRKGQIPTRWIDQGASQAIGLMEVKNRKTSGLVEMIFKKHISDRTDWRKMLKGDPEAIDLVAWKHKLLKEVGTELAGIEHSVLEDEVRTFRYPVERYPEKVSSLSFDKVPQIQSILLGIKGQYLIFEAGVFNVRAHTGYEVTIQENHGT